uniref:DUF2141 domain-containing protein n=1 Tax=Altererythrobacter segetis TaxID=1104773 RepID=UPI00140A9F1D|nr:DUF2141 domain-containing protein [Altererythrobacter segetis]
MKRFLGKATAALVLAVVAIAAPAAAQFRNKIADEPANCRAGGPAVNVRISGITPAKGILRVQLYRGTEADWLKTGRWLNRIEVPVHGTSETVCMPVPGKGTYAIAVRHDVNGNGKTDLRADGGGMSNNPSISILNLGKPSYKQTAFAVADGVKSISIQMRYF